MNIIRTYKFKLYRSKKNQRLHRQIDIAGLVYNHCIALHRRYYRLTSKRLSAYSGENDRHFRLMPITQTG
jgi:putative transposase